MDTADEKVIMVMGVTGVGKSTFIKALTRRNDISIGHGVTSCTEKVTSYRFEHAGQKFILVDTPGFDDTYKSDYDVLLEVAKWLKLSYSRNTKLTGVIYLHRISDTRLQGCSHRNLRMFKNLCGDDFYSNITLGTTFWTGVSDITGQQREAELRDSAGFFHDMIEQGALMVRVEPSFSACVAVLMPFATVEPKPMLIQTELVSQNMTTAETSAALCIDPGIGRARAANEQALVLDRERSCQNALNEETRLREERELARISREKELQELQKRNREMYRAEQQRLHDSDRQRRDLLQQELKESRAREQRQAALHEEEIASARRRDRHIQQQVMQIRQQTSGKIPEVLKVPEGNKIPEARKIPEVGSFRW